MWTELHARKKFFTKIQLCKTNGYLKLQIIHERKAAFYVLPEAPVSDSTSSRLCVACTMYCAYSSVDCSRISRANDGQGTAPVTDPPASRALSLLQLSVAPVTYHFH